jgi:hypothetical protein
MIIDYITTETEIGFVVKLRRSQASKRLGQNFMATDLITIVKPEHMGDFERDFSIYLQLEEKDRTAFIERLKTTARYTGGWLSEDMIPAGEPVPQDLFAG